MAQMQQMQATAAKAMATGAKNEAINKSIAQQTVPTTYFATLVGIAGDPNISENQKSVAISIAFEISQDATDVDGALNVANTNFLSGALDFADGSTAFNASNWGGALTKFNSAFQKYTTAINYFNQAATFYQEATQKINFLNTLTTPQPGY